MQWSQTLGRATALLLVAAYAALDVSVAGSGETLSEVPVVETGWQPISDADQEIVDWADNLFDTAGLKVPPVDIELHDSHEPCGGSEGRLVTSTTGPGTVLVCATHDKPEVQDRWRRRTLVHELAHAWSFGALTEDDRKAFLELRGLQSWLDPNDPWHLRGAEHAAEIVLWGLVDFDIVLVKLPNRSCDELTRAFLLLVGQLPPNGAHLPAAV